MEISQETSPAIIDRVKRTCTRLGFLDCEVKHSADGQVTVHCPGTSRDDCSLMHAAIRVLPGVRSVAFVNRIKSK